MTRAWSHRGSPLPPPSEPKLIGDTLRKHYWLARCKGCKRTIPPWEERRIARYESPCIPVYCVDTYHICDRCRMEEEL